MALKSIIEKAFWHIFKVMPCEMILKKKWSQYNYIASSYVGRSFDLSCIEKRNKGLLNNDRVIWVYWDSGISKAPTIVQHCVNSIKRNAPEGWTVVLLDHESLKDYISLPSFAEELLNNDCIYKATYSDLLRTALLYRYGGIWMDATCFLTASIPEQVLMEKLFMFSMGGLLPCEPEKFESWFIKANAENYVLGKVLENLLYYLKNSKTPKSIYYVWFYILSGLYYKDKHAKEEMDQILFWSHLDALLVQNHYRFESIFSTSMWKKVQYRCFVQKLTYKYDKKLESEDCLLSAILSERI